MPDNDLESILGSAHRRKDKPHKAPLESLPLFHNRNDTWDRGHFLGLWTEATLKQDGFPGARVEVSEFPRSLDRGRIEAHMKTQLGGARSNQ